MSVADVVAVPRAQASGTVPPPAENSEAVVLDLEEPFVAVERRGDAFDDL
jgi:hypothetical protein